MNNSEMYNALTRAAQEHGEEVGIESEVGDMQVLFAAAYFLLTKSQKKKFWKNSEVLDLLDLPEYESVRRMVDENPL